tara:strand:+ start:317 stop:583 length:267 start_codon:yes stop_codon:yes gene_type:complete
VHLHQIHQQDRPLQLEEVLITPLVITEYETAIIQNLVQLRHEVIALEATAVVLVFQGHLQVVVHEVVEVLGLQAEEVVKILKENKYPI